MNHQKYISSEKEPLQYIRRLANGQKQPGLKEVAAGSFALEVNIVLEKWNTQVFYAFTDIVEADNTITLASYLVEENGVDVLKFIVLRVEKKKAENHFKKLDRRRLEGFVKVY